MICHTFKVESERLPAALAQYGEYTLGVLVQANHGGRRNLRIAGIPVGVELAEQLKKKNSTDEAFKNSSIIVVVATDCPLLPHQLKRLARRVPLGIGIVGGRGENYSGDIFLAFSTAPMVQKNELGCSRLTYPNHKIDVLFNAVVQATEEAIVNAFAAETMEGIKAPSAFHQPLQKS
jgi:L-aminopeptidase/D-esterase-like protein